MLSNTKGRERFRERTKSYSGCNEENKRDKDGMLCYGRCVGLERKRDKV